jgi:serine phosphatase RsbU (regulator of sigma subunit)
MVLWNEGPAENNQAKTAAAHQLVQRGASTSARLARELYGGRYSAGQRLDLRAVAGEYKMDLELVLEAFAEFQSLGIVTLSGRFSAVVHSPNPKEMHEAYEIRAALEEIAGRAAAKTLKGNTTRLQEDLDAMRTAVKRGDLDSYAEHAANFHRTIVIASQNEVVLRVWNILAFELRIRAMIGKTIKDLRELAESHQSIVEALHHGRGTEAGALLRNQIYRFLDGIKKAERDSGTYKAIRIDLERAKDVQKSFLPPGNLSIPCLGSETFYLPAGGLGGDYYDFIPLEGGRWGIAIGDVSGKGISAALMMASLQASLRAQALHPHSDLSKLIGQVNRAVHESSPADSFASLFYAEYEPTTRLLEYVNAGHHPPMVVRTRGRRSKAYHLKSTDVPIGISTQTKFPTAAFQLHIDDLFVAYTDGITEAENREQELWGMHRLENLLRSSSDATAEQIIERILDEVSTFADGQSQRDDITLMAMRVQPGCGT